jgi:hypothetical protein
MNFRKILPPILGVVLIVSAWRGYGWAGVALAVGGVVMWMLIHFNQIMRALKRASNRPVGSVDSAVMLNAKLKRGVNLLHVLALTRSIGRALTPENQQPEIFQWTDSTESSVNCEFMDGRLVKWTLVRPPPADAPAASTDS